MLSNQLQGVRCMLGYFISRLPTILPRIHPDLSFIFKIVAKRYEEAFISTESKDPIVSSRPR